MRAMLLCAIATGLLAGGCTGANETGRIEVARDIRVAIYAGEGADPAPLARALKDFGFPVREVSASEIGTMKPGDAKVLCLPGGWYFFPQRQKDAIVAFVKSGGGCVGSCAGAYNVVGHIPLIPGRVLRCNMRGRLYIEPQQGEHPILRGAVRPCTRHSGRKWEPVAVTHLGGPLMLPEDRGTIVASYDLSGEIGAILASEVGAGRAVALASHPELDLADLPAGDPARADRSPLPQGEAALILRNAVLWAARCETSIR